LMKGTLRFMPSWLVLLYRCSITFFTTAVFPVPGFPKINKLDGRPFFNITDSDCAIVVLSLVLNGSLSGT
jgi:hypothetical protein